MTIYTRAGCHLCEEAERALEAVRGELAFALERVDIESDDELFKRYLERIPVIAFDGDELYDLFVDVGDLRKRLRSQ